ncbi:MAG: MMPL family transporter [Chloroflexota bacterium]|nr:MMPL family transporter [Chloroflexota bacterium]
MNKVLGWLSWLVTARPFVTILILLLITVLLGAGATQRVPPPDTAATLPQGSAVALALQEIKQSFRESGEASVVTLLFRGNALTPEGLAQMDSLINKVLSDPDAQALLAPVNPVVAPSDLYKVLLQTGSFESVTQADIDAAQGPPEIMGALAALTGIDTDGTTPVSIATIRLQDTGDERLATVERNIDQLVRGSQGPLTVSTVSPVIIEDAYKKATEEGMAPLVGLAFLLIAALILLFMRTISDLLLTLAGLLMSIVWIVGAEGWLGPKALGLTGPPNSLTTMVPIIVIGLTVDYAIQIVSHYREQRNSGESVVQSVRLGLRNVTVPLVLAAVTTIVSMLANLFSPIEIVGDFGIIAGLGVGMSLVVMLTLIPAGRTIIDRRRERRGTLKPPNPIANALPGIGKLAELLGRSITRAPGPYLGGVLLLTAGLGYAATGLESEFSIRDILPRNGELLRDMDSLDAAVGGSTEMATVLLKAEITETRTLLNLQDFTSAFEDERQRPQAAAGPIHSSFDLLAHDWTQDSGLPGDKYAPELEALFHQASASVQLDPVLMQQFVDKLEALDPEFRRIVVNNPEGVDTLLLQFPTFSGEPSRTKVLQEELEGLWFGRDEDLTATSGSIISVTVTDAITERQTEAITTTIIAALAVLAIFFWITLRQPALAVIAVGPIVLVLIAVLGTMALLGIPYTIITSIITALSIGIGVDYTIHMIHRYREEYSHTRDPERAAVRTLGTTGSALLGSALTTALGLGVLVASPLAASQQFGFTAAITIAYSLLVSIIVVPAAMTFWGAYQNMRLRSMVQRWSDELDMHIEAVHARHEEENQGA